MKAPRLVDVHSYRIDDDGEALVVWLTTARGGTLSVWLPLRELAARGVMVEPERPLPKLVCVNG